MTTTTTKTGKVQCRLRFETRKALAEILSDQWLCPGCGVLLSYRPKERAIYFLHCSDCMALGTGTAAP